MEVEKQETYKEYILTELIGESKIKAWEDLRAKLIKNFEDLGDEMMNGLEEVMRKMQNRMDNNDNILTAENIIKSFTEIDAKYSGSAKATAVTIVSQFWNHGEEFIHLIRTKVGGKREWDMV